MAASVVAGRLAAALHRRTHRVTSALAYAALEWVLIALLLINGLLAYAIARFADYFGLDPPCLLCSRVDRLFQADGGARRLRDALCGEHAAEISALGYCLSHRRLAEARAMCEACLASSKDMASDAGEKGAAMTCSCCEAVVWNSPRELQDTRESRVEEIKVTEEEEEEQDHGYAPLAQDEHEEEEEQEEVQFPQQQDEVQGQEERHDEEAAAVEDGSLEAMAQVDEIIAPEDDRLVPVVALDEMTIADESGLRRDVQEGYGTNRADHEQDSRDVDTGVILKEKMVLNSAVATPTDAAEHSILPGSSIPHPETATSDPDENSSIQVEEDTAETGDSTAEERIDVPLGTLVVYWFLMFSSSSPISWLSSSVTEAVPEDDSIAAEVDTNCEVSIGSEICEHESAASEEPVAPSAVPDDQSSPLESLLDAAPTEQGIAH